MEKAIKVVIADDHSLFRECLSNSFKANGSEIEITGQVGDGISLFQSLRKTKCDVLLLDILMPGTDSLDLMKALKIEFPNLPVLILSTHAEDLFAPRFLRAGASGYFCKMNSLDGLTKSIKKVSMGRLAISNSLSNLLALKGLDPYKNKSKTHELLSDREFQVMCLMGAGIKPSEVANTLNLSPKTVSAYRCQIMEKMGWKNNAQMMRYTIDNNLVI